MQGALAPFAASVALFAGYLVVKFFPNLNLQVFLNLYFWLIGSIAIFGALQSPLRQSVGSPEPLWGPTPALQTQHLQHVDCF